MTFKSPPESTKAYWSPYVAGAASGKIAPLAFIVGMILGIWGFAEVLHAALTLSVSSDKIFDSDRRTETRRNFYWPSPVRTSGGGNGFCCGVGKCDRSSIRGQCPAA